MNDEIKDSGETMSNKFLVELSNIGKHYSNGDTEIRALDGVDLSIEKGEFFVYFRPVRIR